MTEPAPRLLARSAGAIADLELLRVARTEIDEREATAHPSVADRIRGLAPLRTLRQQAAGRPR